jgi:hypothetical protein
MFCGTLIPVGGIAQLVRALACHVRGRGFESRCSRFPKKFKKNFVLLIEQSQYTFHS